LEDFDPNASDPNDSDFEAGASSPRPRRSNPSHKRKKSQHRTPQKKRPRARYGSDSDIVDDEEEIEEEEFTESSDDGGPVEINTRTGRAVRSAARERKNYEESDEDGEGATFVEETGESEVEEEERDELNISPKKSRGGTKHAAANAAERPATQIVRLRFSNWKGLSSSSRPSPAPAVKDEQPATMTRTRNTRSRTASRPPTSAATAAMGTRKSSRISHEPEPMVALSSSGRHAIPASSMEGEDDDDDEIISMRQRRVGSKGPRATAAAKQPLRKMPSIVMEQSHEGTQAEAADEPEEEEEAEAPPHDVVDSVEIHVTEAEVVEEAADAGEPMEAEDAPAVEEPAGDDEFRVAESDDSDGPVGRRRTLRVSLNICRIAR
jgi:hypothetical protein